MRASQSLMVPRVPERPHAWELAHILSLSPQSVWESADSDLAPMNPLGSGVIQRCFSGTPLLPPLSSRLGTTGDVEPSACVVFNIEAGGNEQSHSLAAGR